MAATLTLAALLLPLALAGRRVPRLAWLAPPALLGLALALTDPFLLRKAVGQALMPECLLWFALYAAALAARRRGRDAPDHRGPARLLAALFLGYGVLGSGLAGGALTAWLEAPFRGPPPEGPFDAVFVLGGGTALRPDGAPQLGGSGDRVLTAARLHLEGRTPLLVCAGRSVGGLHQDEPRDLAAETRTLWRAMGVPEAAILTVEGPRTTGEEMEALAALARERGWRRVGLVTSAWHLRRTLAGASRRGLAVVPIAADFRGQVPVWNLVTLLPSGPGFQALRTAWWEVIGAWLSP